MMIRKKTARRKTTAPKKSEKENKFRVQKAGVAFFVGITGMFIIL
jgi:hypothetical protein